MFVKKTFMETCRPPPPVFFWNISEFFRTIVPKGTGKQLFLYLVQFNQTIQ